MDPSTWAQHCQVFKEIDLCDKFACKTRAALFRQRPSTRNSLWQLNGTTTSRGLFHFIAGKVQTVFSGGSVSQCVCIARIDDTLSISTPCFSCPSVFFFFTKDMLRILLVLAFN